MLPIRPVRIARLSLFSLTLISVLVPDLALAEDPAPVIPKKLIEQPIDLSGKQRDAVMTFVRKGGFAGFDQELRVYADGTFSANDRARLPHLARRGRMNDAQKATLKKLLATFGKARYSHSDGPRVADGMKTEITISGTGKKTTLDPKDEEFRKISAFAGELLRATKR